MFAATKDAFAQIERAHDLFWSAAVSMWNTRAQVVGLRMMAPDIEPSMLAARIAAGSGLQGSNVVSAAKRFTWEEELSEIALLRLIQLFAHYEGWLEELAGDVVRSSSKRRSWCKNMTFPFAFQTSLNALGASNAMRDLYASSKPHVVLGWPYT